MRRREEIRRLAEETRVQYWSADVLPVDIDLILERLRVEIIPVARLRKEVGVDACIAADLTAVYLDLEYSRDERMNPRVRFSLAHELGHIVLHPHIFEDYRAHAPGGVLDWAKHIRSRYDIELLERESNEFAGCFLVPADLLQDRYNKLYPFVSQRMLENNIDPESVSAETLYGYMANEICREFEVSSTVIEIRLGRIDAHSRRVR